jgi:pimeloyl-ACP methyl ester carboxylesterase
MPYASVGEEKIYYAQHPSPTLRAPDLLLVHGAGGNHQLWGSTVRNLLAANVYALDLPGHGRSGGIGRCSIADIADFVLAFMDVLHLRQAIIAGHSMGGATALQMALRDPQRIQGLVLVGAGARLRVLPAILEHVLSDFEHTVDFICESAYSVGTSRELVRQGQRQMLQVAPQTILDDFSACNAFDVTERLVEIRCPTLVICGTEDRLTPVKYATLLAEKIPGAELKLIEGAGHMVMTEKPGLVAEAIEMALTRWSAVHSN